MGNESYKKKIKKYKVYNIKLVEKLKICISIKKNRTYWAFINKKWKRIAEVYFVLLKKDIQIISNDTKMITKSQCLGVTKKGVMCSRVVSDIYCFQHKRENFLNTACYAKAKERDQFYTTQNNVSICTQVYNKFININKEEDIIIEPSAGCGSFINSINKLCNNIFLIDIDPKHKLIQAGNFLNFNKNLDKFKKVHLIGNPPFSIINKFLKQAFKITDSLGFILPLSFRKESRKKIFPLNFHCIHEHIVLDNNFHFNGREHKVPTIFQIWEKRKYNRDAVINISSKYIEFVKKKNNPTLAFRRVGAKCGEISTIIQDKSESSYYFIKLKKGLDIFKFFEIYKKVKFFHNNTVAQKSISQQELLLELKKYDI